MDLNPSQAGSTHRVGKSLSGHASGTPIPPVIHRRYRHVDDLGEGGMGRVVLVEDNSRDGERCALKWVPSSDPPSPQQARHTREFRILSRFDHPHLLRVFHLGQDTAAGGQYFTCEHLAGPLVSDLIGEVEDRIIHTVIAQLFRTLGYLHNQKWVHGDLKPNNMMLRHPIGEDEPQMCLLDFGLAHLEGRPPEEKIVGTVQYMPPEMILGARLDRRGDLYSAGICAYQMLTGRLPFAGDKAEVTHSHLNRPPLRLRDVRPEIPARTEEVILALLEKRAGDRPQSAEEALKGLLESFEMPAVLETKKTLKAYVRNRSFSGWEAPLRTILSGAAGCFEDDRDLSAVTTEEEFEVQLFLDESPAVSEHGDGAAAGETKLFVLRNPETEVASFRQALVNRLEVMGMRYARVEFSGSGCPFASLVHGILSFLPAQQLREERLFRQLSFALPEPHEDATKGMRRFARWISKIGAREPFVVILGDLADWGESFYEFMSLVGEQRATHPGLNSVLWVGFQGKPLALSQACWLAQPEHRAWLEVLPLDPLDPGALGRWLQTRFPGWSVPQRVQNLVEEESEGNPLLLESILESMVDDGLLTRDWSGWHVDLHAGENRQSPLVKRAAASYRALPDAPREVLEALVVLGGSSDREWLKKLCSIEEEQVDAAIEDLLASEWIEPERQGLRLCVSHRYQRNAVRHTMSTEFWKAGNEMVADWLLGLQEQGRDIDAQRLAQHLIAAERGVDALSYAKAVVSRSLAQGSILGAIRWLERILSVGNELAADDRIELLDQLGDLRMTWGPPTDSRRAWGEAMRIDAKRGGGSILAGELAVKLAELEGRAGNLPSCFKLLRKAVPVLEGANNVDLYRRAVLLQLESWFVEGMPEKARESWGTLKQLPKSQQARLIGREAMVRTQYMVAAGRREAALETLESALTALKLSSRPRSGAWSEYLRANSARLRNRWSDAAVRYRRAARLFGSCHDTANQGRCLLMCAEMELQLGGLADAKELFDRAEVLLERVGVVVELPRVWLGRGLVLSRCGWREEAREYFAKVKQWGDRFPKSRWGWEAMLTDVEVGTRHGHVRRAHHLIRGRAHLRHAPHRHEPETMLRWSFLAHRLACKMGLLAHATEILNAYVPRLSKLAGLFFELPLWIRHWRALVTYGCKEEADRLQANIRKWLRQHPEHEPFWRVAEGRASEEDLHRHGNSEEIAMFYRCRAVEAMDAGEMDRALFILDQAQDHARRGRALPILPLVSARQAVARDAVVPNFDKAERLVRRAWKALTTTGVVTGRVELLALWATLRARNEDPRAAAILWASARRNLQRSCRGLPFECDIEAVAQTCGIKSRELLQPQSSPTS